MTTSVPGARTVMPARVAVLSPVLAELPPAAMSLYTVVTLPPDARGAWYLRVGEQCGRVDNARTSVMAQLTALPSHERNSAIRVAQTASLLGRLILAAARIAAQGSGEVPPRAADHARSVVKSTEAASAAMLGHRDECEDPPRMHAVRGTATARGVDLPDAPQWRPAAVLHALDVASTQMDVLMDTLISGRADGRAAARSGVAVSLPR